WVKLLPVRTHSSTVKWSTAAIPSGTMTSPSAFPRTHTASCFIWQCTTTTPTRPRT
ncbi:hypothetical protein SARC_13337, partial [Sphaeroforma arctica JP610]